MVVPQRILYDSPTPKSTVQAVLPEISRRGVSCRCPGIDEASILLTVAMVFPLLSGRKFIVTSQPLIDTAPEALKMSMPVGAALASVFAMAKSPS